MKKVQKRNGQQGFTIIELVVVILLLGILTATALPRFMDVTTEARAAVLDATTGGMTTGAALYKAQWFAEQGVSGDIPTGWSTASRSDGYPQATDDPSCQNVYDDLLQAGSAAMSSATFNTTTCDYVLADNIGSFSYTISTGQAN